MNLRNGRNTQGQLVVMNNSSVRIINARAKSHAGSLVKASNAKMLLEQFKKLKILVMPLRTLVLLLTFVLMLCLSLISKFCDKLSSFLMYKIFIYYGGGGLITFMNDTQQWTNNKINGTRERMRWFRNLFRLPEIPVIRFRAPIVVEKRMKEL
jgi:hypothetical protein